MREVGGGCFRVSFALFLTQGGYVDSGLQEKYLLNALVIMSHLSVFCLFVGLFF